jgi:hypothetical protein
MIRSLVDITSAFSTVDLVEDLYMELPKGMIPQPGKALKVLKSLNGLKQSGANWHSVAHTHLVDQGFNNSIFESGFYWIWKLNILTMISLYVDDFYIASDSDSILQENIESFKRKFKCKVQPADLFLGIRIQDIGGNLYLSQETAIKDVLASSGFLECAPVGTPSIPGSKLEKASADFIDETTKLFPYRETLGKLLWISRCTRPDIFYAVNQLCSYPSNFDSTHVAAMKHVLRYLKGTIQLKLKFSGGNREIKVNAYADADFAGEPERSATENPFSSLSGSIIYLANIGPVYWGSKLQSTLARSTGEAEYRSCGSAAQRLMSVRNFLDEIGFPQTSPSLIYEDNMAAINMAQLEYCSVNTKHIKIDHHFLKQLVKEKEVSIVYCPTTVMLADLFTKSLPKPRFLELREQLMQGVWTREL